MYASCQRVRQTSTANLAPWFSIWWNFDSMDTVYRVRRSIIIAKFSFSSVTSSFRRYLFYRYLSTYRYLMKRCSLFVESVSVLICLVSWFQFNMYMLGINFKKINRVTSELQLVIRMKNIRDSEVILLICCYLSSIWLFQVSSDKSISCFNYSSNRTCFEQIYYWTFFFDYSIVTQ